MNPSFARGFIGCDTIEFSKNTVHPTRRWDRSVANKATIDKQQLLDAAYDIASNQGLDQVTIRNVAKACDVSVGSIYNYYATKADLVTGVVERFWSRAIPEELMHAREKEGFVDFLERFSFGMKDVFADFKSNWLIQLAALDRKTIDTGLRLEERYFDHIRKGLKRVLDDDTRIDASFFPDDAARIALVDFAWESILIGLTRSSGTDDTLFTLLRTALYR